MADRVPNIQHLKQGRAYPDPIATAKTNSHFKNTAKHVEIHPTPDSKSGKADGYLGGKNSPDGGQGWAPMDAVTKRNTFTGS